MNHMKEGAQIVKDSVKGFITEEEGVGVVEIILILVILVGLVVVFRDKIESIVSNALNKVGQDSSSIYSD